MAAGLGVKAAPFTYVAHALAVAAAVMVLVWCIHFRGGLAFEATNKNLIFNVSTTFSLFSSLGIFSSRALGLDGHGFGADNLGCCVFVLFSKRKLLKSH